MRAEGTRAPDS